MSNEEKITIKINDNGSIRVTGDVELIDGEGNPFQTGSTFSLCRCGQSNKKPFCDGTHKKIQFASAPRASQ
ncbi:CDGSH iron-sulfur domain-containing protein [Niallia endozanthoxylica]|uniref:CDGSH iron-sulfur domain-containing protein n=1 Tax=Niallia endozanthoxylica TaxID=2036016 RepID=A0A5J5I1L5_9BACI|nr:CDGSH iron-sulfur domain-containing protein [Niallia endozanthoxylica]KAA9028430.1 CDGSH iron-sulfur domain-containing protein [Niallia endozanthoxylica]